MTDGRVITGLAVEDTPDRLVLKTAEGQRVTLQPGSIEDRRTSDVSLMPEGLAQPMTDDELVDLLAYLTTLRQPVSIVGQYHAIGPIHEASGAPRIDVGSKINLQASVVDGKGHDLSWRRTTANAEGLADLTPLVVGDPKNVAYAYTAVVSPRSQSARLVVDSPAGIAVWLNGKPVVLTGGSHDKSEPRTAVVDLPEGTSSLLIRVAVDGRPNAQASLVTTLVADRPVGFNTGGEPSLSSREPQR
jgi:hypothetical protein